MPFLNVCWSGNKVHIPFPLHPHYSVVTRVWQCSVTLHICDAQQCHFTDTIHFHSNVILKLHSNANPKYTLHCNSITTTPMPLTVHPDATPGCLWSVDMYISDALLCHSNTTPQGWSGTVVCTPVHGDNTQRRHSKIKTLLPLREGKWYEYCNERKQQR